MWSNVINMKANAVSSEHLSGNSVDTPFGKIDLFSMPNAVSEHDDSNTAVFQRQCFQTCFHVTICSHMINMKSKVVSRDFV